VSLRLHDYAASGNCYKVRLLLAQLDREYERVPVDIFAGDTLTEEFGRLNPVRETPVLEEDGADPLPESNWPPIAPAGRRPCAGSSGSSRR
jgi:glutathione S-transferase